MDYNDSLWAHLGEINDSTDFEDDNEAPSQEEVDAWLERVLDEGEERSADQDELDQSSIDTTWNTAARHTAMFRSASGEPEAVEAARRVMASQIYEVIDSVTITPHEASALLSVYDGANEWHQERLATLSTKRLVQIARTRRRTGSLADEMASKLRDAGITTAEEAEDLSVDERDEILGVSAWGGDEDEAWETAKGMLSKESRRRTAATPDWLNERNNDPYGTPGSHEFWTTVDYEDVGDKRLVSKDGGWYGHHRRQNYWMTFSSEEEARAWLNDSAHLDMWANKRTAGNPHPVGSSAWFDWEADPTPVEAGPASGVPRDLFPDGGVPLRGELTPEQEAWLKRRGSHRAAGIEDMLNFQGTLRVAAEGQTCEVCGDAIAQTDGDWHHDNGEKHDHEAKPEGGDSTKESRFRQVGVAPHPDYGEGVWTSDEVRAEVLSLDSSQPPIYLVPQIMEILERHGYDSIDRELAFWHHSQVAGRPYDDYYNVWLHTPSKTASRTAARVEKQDTEDYWAGTKGGDDYVPLPWVIVANDGTVLGAYPTEERANEDFSNLHPMVRASLRRQAVGDKDASKHTAERAVKVIVIKADKTVEDRTVTGYREMQAIVGGLIEPIDLKDGSTLWVNEEFLYSGGEPNWIASDVAGLGGRPEFMLRQPILGDAFMTGGVDDEGETLDVTESGRRLVQRVKREAGGPEWKRASMEHTATIPARAQQLIRWLENNTSGKNDDDQIVELNQILEPLGFRWYFKDDYTIRVVDAEGSQNSVTREELNALPDVRMAARKQAVADAIATCMFCGGRILGIANQDYLGNLRWYHGGVGTKECPGGGGVASPVPGTETRDFEYTGSLERTAEVRPIHRIYDEIVRDWRPVNYGAVPYLDAMRYLDSIDDNFGADDARSIVAYFLSNASSWRGETAKRVKAELKAMLGRTASKEAYDSGSGLEELIRDPRNPRRLYDGDRDIMTNEHRLELAEQQRDENEDEHQRSYEGSLANWWESTQHEAMPAPADLGVKVGDFFYCSWGYDQTNVNFYEVIRLTGQGVEVKPVASQVVSGGGPSESVVPVPGAYTTRDVLIGMDRDSKVCRLKEGYGGRPSIALGRDYSATLWDGTPKHQTGVGFGH